jgi:hypothetical protein
MTDAIARNDTSDAAGRWLLPIIPPQEAWTTNDSSRSKAREVPDGPADSLARNRSTQARVDR